MKTDQTGRTDHFAGFVMRRLILCVPKKEGHVLRLIITHFLLIVRILVLLKKLVA